MPRLLTVLCLTLCMGACSTGPSWDIFADRSFNITFAYHPSYIRDEQIEHGIQFGDKKIDADSIALRKGMGEMAFMSITQSKDPLIVSYLVENSVQSRKVPFGHGAVKVFTGEGMGTPEQYLFVKEDNYIILSFVFPPSQTDIDRTLSSVVLR